MSDLFEHFTNFREFVDIRQDQFIDIVITENRIRSINGIDNINDLIVVLENIDAKRVLERYAILSSCARVGLRSTLRIRIETIDFNRFKPIAEGDYV